MKRQDKKKPNIWKKTKTFIELGQISEIGMLIKSIIQSNRKRKKNEMKRQETKYLKKLKLFIGLGQISNLINSRAFLSYPRLVSCSL